MKLLGLLLFWCSAGLLAYIYIGFPLLCALRAVFCKKPIRCDTQYPFVSICIAAHNEEAVIGPRIRNILELSYPDDKWELILVADGCTDETVTVAKNFDDKRIRVISVSRNGKNVALNRAAAAAKGEILVFTDADVLFRQKSLTQLLSCFSDEGVGCVAGQFEYEKDTLNNNAGERRYWQLDTMLKRLQAAAGSVTSATGQIYAIRKMLFKEAPDGVTDDFYISVQAVLQGYRIVYAPDALAFGQIASTEEHEFKRKVRVISAGLKGVWAVRELCNPLKYGFYAIQLVSHKVLRRFAFVPLLALIPSSLMLLSEGRIYIIAAVSQALLHTCGAAGYTLRQKKKLNAVFKPLTLACYFDMVYAAAIVAIVNILKGKRLDIWTPVNRI